MRAMQPARGSALLRAQLAIGAIVALCLSGCSSAYSGGSADQPRSPSTLTLSATATATPGGFGRHSRHRDKSRQGGRGPGSAQHLRRPASRPGNAKAAEGKLSGIPRGAQAATVLSITDGDTLHVRALRPGPVLHSTGDVTVRLLEIDTPETVDPSQPVACFGEKASAELSRLVPPGSRVWVLPDRQLIDPYGRTLLYMWRRSGARTTFVNLELVRRGYARAVLYEPNDRYIAPMRAAEATARAADRGLWGACPYFGAPAHAAHHAAASRHHRHKHPRGLASTGGRHCDPSYPTVCIPPPPPDLDCSDIRYTNFKVRGTDPDNFDSDGDGIGCES